MGPPVQFKLEAVGRLCACWQNFSAYFISWACLSGSSELGEGHAPGHPGNWDDIQNGPGSLTCLHPKLQVCTASEPTGQAAGAEREQVDRTP